MPSGRDIIGLRKLVLTILLVALLQAFTQPVRAEVRVTGQADAVIVETREASVEEVLAALRASFNLQYRTIGAFNRVITGTYTGSLQRVVARLLEGHNYVMKSSAGGGELIVVEPGAAGSSVSTSGRPVVAVAEQRGWPTPNSATDVHGRDATAPVAPPRAPAVSITSSATQAVPRISPSSQSVPTLPSANSVVAPAMAVAEPHPLSPLPGPVLQQRPPGLPGPNG